MATMDTTSCRFHEMFLPYEGTHTIVRNYGLLLFRVTKYTSNVIYIDKYLAGKSQDGFF